MKTIIEITKKDLDNYQKYSDLASDYPYYISTSNISKEEIILIGKLSELQIGDNNTPLKITIERL